MASLRRAAELPPETAETYFVMGIVLDRLNDPAGAQVSFGRALQINPQMAQAHLLRGNLFRRQGRMKDAVEAYHAALNLRPDLKPAADAIAELTAAAPATAPAGDR